MIQPTGRSLHVAFGGGNDLLAASQAVDRVKVVDRAAATLTSIVADLQANGATDILVPNLPDVGMTPALRGWGNWVIAEARRLTSRFNASVDEGLHEIGAWHSFKLYRLDIWAMAEEVTRDPGAFGFTNVTTPCRSLLHCNGYLFWDEVHPTTRAHARLAEAAVKMLEEP